MCWNWWMYHLKSVLILHTERNVPAIYKEHNLYQLLESPNGKHSNFFTETYHGKVLYHWFFLPSSKLEANLSQPLSMFLADFVGDVPLIGWKHVSSASLITTGEDLGKQVKGSQHCQAIKKIRSPHRSVRSHFVQFHLLIALLFPACAWRGREGDFNSY